MITRPMLLDETGQKIKLALQRVKNKFLGTTTDPVTPGQAGSSGVSPVIQDDTGREIISALNDLADAVKPASTTEQGLVNTGTQKFGGQKVFDKVLSINISSGTGYPMLYFRDGVHHPIDEVGGYASAGIFNVTSDITQNRLGFALWSPKSDGTGYTKKSESFMLPVVDVGRTTNGAYRIITTKNIEDIPDADATIRGLVNTGAQSFAGVKIFEHGSGIRSSGAYTDINIFGAGDSTRDMSITGKTDTGYNCLYFNEYHRTNGTTQPYVDSFFLPASGEDNANHAYDILTTKTIYTKSDTSSISGVQLRRWGNIVTIFLRGARVNSSGSIGTIPTGYRPSAYLYANCVHTAAGGVVRPAQITIESSGTTQINAYNGSNNYGLATNGYVNGTITFVVN